MSKAIGTYILGFMLAAMIASSGCKNNPVSSPVKVENFSVTTTTATNNDEWLDLGITLSTGNFTVAAITLPIIDPKNPGTEYGSLSLQTVLCSTPATCPYGNGVTVGVNLDMTSILKVKSLPPLLPNGGALPVGGLQNSTVVALPISNTGAKIYFAFGKGVAMFGAAVPFAGLDVVGQYIPGANLFIPVAVPVNGKSFILEPGIFTGSTPNTTGIGFFADLSQLVPQSALLSNLTSYDHHSAHLVSSLTMQTVAPSAQDRKKLFKKLKEMNQQNINLELR